MSRPNLLPYYSAEELVAATQPEKTEMLDELVTGLQNQEIRAGNTAYDLATSLFDINGYRNYPSYAESELSYGIMSPTSSLGLVKGHTRLNGFINAIERWPQQEGVIDVGCGVFPVLALASAIYHPAAEITAVEINPDSAQVAEKIVDMFGLSKRLHVVNADIATHMPDANTTAAVTETFNSALVTEPGPKIVQLLHNMGIPTITPSSALLCLTIPRGMFFKDIDLRTDTYAEIDFENWAADETFVRGLVDVRAAYYDDRGKVLGFEADRISKGLDQYEELTLRRVMNSAPASGRLVYELGGSPFKPKVESLQTAPGVDYL